MRERSEGFGVEGFVGIDEKGDEITEYSVEQIWEFLRVSEITVFELSTINRTLLLQNRRDFHEFLIASGIGNREQESGEEEFDCEGVIIPNLNRNAQVLLAESSVYGLPFQTHPAYVLLGKIRPWEIRANHRVSGVKLGTSRN